MMDQISNEKVGQFIACLRREQQLTQRQLAERICLGQGGQQMGARGKPAQRGPADAAGPIPGCQRQRAAERLQGTGAAAFRHGEDDDTAPAQSLADQLLDHAWPIAVALDRLSVRGCAGEAAGGAGYGRDGDAWLCGMAGVLCAGAAAFLL